MSYKVNGLSELGLRFRGQNDDFLLEAFVKSHVFLHAIEIDGRLKIMIEVGEDTRAEQLRKVIPYALELRDKSIEFQGAWSFGGPNAFFEYLCDLKDSEMTYTEIAQRLKSRVEEHLREAVAFDDEFRKALPALKTYGDYFMWAFGEDGIHTQFNPHSFDHAKYILENIGMSANEITEWLKEGIENIRAGKAPFGQNPITRTKMIQILRTWRKGKKHKSIRVIEEKTKEEHSKQLTEKV
jgi:hypothetical protein